MAGGEIELGAGAAAGKSKTSPVKLKARSGQPIEHWYWGRIVHDLSGMRLHKNRLPIDYAHNDAEVLGYLNHFETDSGDLITSGAITPFNDSDRASEVLHKMREGVPYEASIFFGGDGIKLQEVAEGEISPVNGYDFEGPGIIVREWPLRGVAICPYGADQNTESSALSAAGKSFCASKWLPAEPAQAEKEKEMASITPAPETAASETIVTEVAVEAKAEATEEKAEEKTEGDMEQDTKPVEVVSVEAKANEENTADDRAEFKRMLDEFGADIAAKVYAAGGTYADAQAEYVAALKADNAKLAAQVKELSAKVTTGGKAADFAANDNKKAASIFKTGK